MPKRFVVNDPVTQQRRGITEGAWRHYQNVRCNEPIKRVNDFFVEVENYVACAKFSEILLVPLRVHMKQEGFCRMSLADLLHDAGVVRIGGGGTIAGTAIVVRILPSNVHRHVEAFIRERITRLIRPKATF